MNVKNIEIRQKKGLAPLEINYFTTMVERNFEISETYEGTTKLKKN